MRVNVHLFDIQQPFSIDIFETDNEEDVQRRLRCISTTLTPFFRCEPSFDVSTFLANPTNFVFVDLGRVFESVQKDPMTQLPPLFQRLGKKFHITLYDFLESWIFYEVFTQYHDPENPSLALLALKSSITAAFLDAFHSRLKDPLNQKPLNRLEVLKRWDSDWYDEKKKMWTMMNDNDREKNDEAVTVGREFLQVKPLPASSLKELGKVIQFDIHTDNVSTGLLFEHIELNPMLCVAQYRTFYKIHVNTTFAAEKIKEEKTHFYALCIFSAQGNLTIHVQNRPFGVSVQCIFSPEHGIQDVPSLLKFLNIKDNVHIENEKSMGLLADFIIENPRPKNMDIFHYAALQSPIFSNLCLNDRRFSRFLSVNDTDKISRQNMSCYVYFHSPIVEKTTADTDNHIYVGGWNRQRSRFGDLTAILTPEQQSPDNFHIHVKVTRSVNTQVVLKFYDMLRRLISLYNTLLDNEMNLFRSYLPHYQPNYVPPKVGTKTIMSLSDADPVLFPPLIYSRICQQPKPVVITEDQAKKLPPERVLKFPPQHLKGFPPQYYTCHDEKNYPYPGFITFKRNVNHPFMIAPCCFKRNNLEKNRELLQLLMTTTTNVPSDKPIPVVFPPRNLYRIKSDKIIDQVGQLAQVPRQIEKLLSFLTSPLFEFSRIGMPSGWEKESILACLEFYHAVQTKRHFFRSQKELRHLLLQENLDITLQQNYDIGLDNVADILKDPSQYIDPRRFYRLLERFFQVNLLILEREDEMIDIVRPYAYRSLEWYVRSNIPVVIIYQHYGGTTEATYNVGLPQCELIGYKDTHNTLHTHIKTTSRVELFFQLAFASFFGDKLNTPTLMNRPSVSSFLVSSLHSQWIDPIGKTRLIFFTESQYPAMVTSPIAPLSLPVYPLSSLWIPTLQHVLDLFQHAQIRQSRVERYGHFLFLHTDAFFTHIMFIVRTSTTTPLPFDVVDIDALPVYMHELLYPRESKFDTHLWNQRFSNILQDYIVIRFAKFLKEKDVNLMKTSQDEIVHLFLDEYVSYEQVYTIPESDTLSPLVNKNPFLFRDDRLRLPQCFSERIPFFLKWFMTTKYDELTILEKARELPSFYQRVCDFTQVPSHVIQLSLQELFPLKSYPYLSAPLDTLILEHDNENDIHYYFNVDETPKTEPYILLQTRNLLRATWIAKRYLKTGEIFFPKQSTPPSMGISEYFIKHTNDRVWTKKGGTNPVVAFYQKPDTSILVFLPIR